MNSRTASVVLPAPREDVFAFISKTENLPKWANIFCKELNIVNGKNKIVTPLGEMFFEIRSDKETGTENASLYNTKAIQIDTFVIFITLLIQG